MTADFIIHDASELATCAGPAPRCGPAQADASILRDASVAAYRGKIVFVGPANECRKRVSLLPNGASIDASGCTVVPGFVDAHTHAVYAGDRRSELQRRLAGATYQQIAAEGGGILSTVGATRQATEEQLAEAALPRLARMLQCGTTTAEVKSGYGLALEPEITMLRAIRRLGTMQPIELVPTFLGAHECPREYRGNRDAYVALVAERMIPAVSSEKLADWCDVFCETGVFTVDQGRTVLAAARNAGLGLRVHADEFDASGGAELAAEMRARSADHLVHVTRQGARALAEAGTVATLLPAAPLFLKLDRYAPARMLIEEGVPVALGTDLNPGGGLTPSMPFVMSLACFAMGLTLEEALVAATINAAYALDVQARTGSLEPGKQLDAVVVGGPLVSLLAPETRPVRYVVKAGRIVFSEQA
ncbi:MAG TPA: imidazolonepropionase [Vicinamibacterales bacterium]|nr:imidazolonepropionase [Vicinamibacterales bacterium]